MTLHTPFGARTAVWPLAMAAVVVFAALLFALVGGAGRAAAAADCKFVLGFKALHAMIPDTVGDCLENELHHPGKGVTLQRTKNGVLTWQKATNHTSFTDGTHTWVVGPLGLQQRLNTERFDWERDFSGPTGGGHGGGGADDCVCEGGHRPIRARRLGGDRRLLQQPSEY